MTQNQLIFKYAGVILLLSPLLNCSCKKESKDTNGIRLSSIYYPFKDNPEHKLVYSMSYTNNALTEVLLHEQTNTDATIPFSKTTYSYFENKILQENYSENNNNWKLQNRTTYEVKNNLITSAIYEPKKGSGSESAYKIIYEYEGNQLVRWTRYISVTTANWQEDEKSEFIYKNDTLNEVHEFSDYNNGTWVKSGKLGFDYEKDKICQLVHYIWQSDSFVINYTQPYIYDANKIISIKTEGLAIDKFFYNSTGDLSVLQNGNSYYFSTQTYQYEQGTGNIAFINYLNNPIYIFEKHPLVTSLR